MNKNIYLVLLFFFLLLLQVFILNKILLFGYVNPYLYIVFVFIYPLKKNDFSFLSYAFLLGLSVDLFSNSGGVNAFATTFIAYIRFYFFRLIFKNRENEYDLINLNSESFGNVFNYTAVLTIIHHFILFSLINFSLYNFSKVLINTVLSSIFTLVLYFLGNFIFRKRNNEA